MILSSGINSICYGNGKYIAAGESGSTGYSADGITWTATPGSESAFGRPVTANSICYGSTNKDYVVVGKSGQVAYSANGTSYSSWGNTTYSGIFGSSSINSICYGNGEFIAVGNDGKMGYVADCTKQYPTSWTAISQKFTTSHLYNICYGNGKYIASGENGEIGYSTDGINWTKINNFTSNVLKVFCYANGKYIAGNSWSGAMYYSTDGISWSTNDSISAVNLVIYANGKFIAGCVYGDMFYSTDGINWSRIYTQGTGATPANLIYVSGKYFMTDISGNFVYSTDECQKWTKIDLGFLVSGICYGNGKYIASGRNGEIAYSTDGINWTKISTSTLLGKIYYEQEIFIGHAKNTIAYSVDGINWVSINQSIFNDSEYISGLVYNNNKFVICGYNGKIAYASAGMNFSNWNAISQNIFKVINANSIGYNPNSNNFLIVGSSGTMAYSNNGTDWNSISQNLTTNDFQDCRIEKTNLFTKQEIIDICNSLVNVQDKFIIYGLFSGIRGNKYEDLVKLKVKDINFDVYRPYTEGNLKITFEDGYNVELKAESTVGIVGLLVKSAYEPDFATVAKSAVLA